MIDLDGWGANSQLPQLAMAEVELKAFGADGEG